jgi:hypothetical protein
MPGTRETAHTSPALCQRPLGGPSPCPGDGLQAGERFLRCPQPLGNLGTDPFNRFFHRVDVAELLS